MAKKLIQAVKMGQTVVKVHYEEYWQEYQVSIKGQTTQGTYHTNDREDALDTAKAMASRANLQAWEPTHVHS